MKAVTAEQMRELDRRTMEEFGTPGEVLMDRAGLGVAESVLRRIGWTGVRCGGVVAVAGRGNNGGDAFVAARYLKEAGVSVELLAACELSAYEGAAAIHCRRMVEAGVPIRELKAPADWRDPVPGCSGNIIIDGLLGTGVKGAAHGTPAAAIEWIVRMSESNEVVAIDIPSGLNADSGEAEGVTVSADWTVTMAAPKRGLIASAALPYVGSLEVIDIGMPPEYTAGMGEGLDLLSDAGMKKLMPRKNAASHKGSHGSLLIVAGSNNFPGAAVLCAMGGVRSGAGLVTVVTVELAAAAVAGAVPEAIVRGVPADECGVMDFDGFIKAAESLPGYNSIVIGPGMTDSDGTARIVEWALANAGRGIVLDADALNVIAKEPLSAAFEMTNLVITPHPGEAGRLLGTDAAEVQSDRLLSLRKLNDRFRAVTVLKGAGTLIGRRDCMASINLTGNAGMAKGGSGDVLAGLLGGLLAQGLSADDASRLAVFVHGRAGDIAACSGSMQGMTAGDTAARLSDAFASLR